MGLTVVDASVAVKWVIAEPGSSEALSLLTEAGQLLAPDLICMEVAGAIARRVRNERFSVEDARAAHAKWRRLLDHDAIMLTPTRELIDRAFEIAIDIRHTIADCVYLASAETLDATVLTADDTMAKRGRLFFDRIVMLRQAA